MPTPPEVNTIEWLTAARERMQELQGLLERAFPAYLFDFLERSEIAALQWRQCYCNEEPLSVFSLDLDFDFSSKEDLSARMEALTQEVEALLASIPVCVMVALFGHEHWVVFHYESFNSHYDDADYSMDERRERKRADFPLAPEAPSLRALLQEFNALREQAATSLQAQLKRLLAENLEQVSAFRWRQYSPYFMDGDYCTFALEDEPTASFDGYFEVFEPLAELLYAVHPETLLRLFGNHAQVTLEDGVFSTAPYTKHD